MRDFDAIIILLLRELNLASKEDLAKALGITYDAIRQRKSKNNIPFREVFILCHDNNINMHDLLMLDGSIEDSRNKRPIEKDLEKIALKQEVAFLKTKLKRSQKHGKHALKMASIEIEFLLSKKQPKSKIPEKYLVKGKIV